MDRTDDVQRPEPLTDEELAAMKTRSDGYTFGICMAAQKYHSDVPRLIADLRASRAREKSLYEKGKDLEEQYDKVVTERNVLQGRVKELEENCLKERREAYAQGWEERRLFNG